MPKIDFSKIDDVDDFQPMPEDTYFCELSEIEERQTQNGDEMWSLKFEVLDGEYTGRYIFDNMVFSEAAMKRVKLICSRLGLEVSGEIDLTPDMLDGRRCHISVEIEEYESDGGKLKKRNVVPFAGYESIESSEPDEEQPEEEGKSLPF